MVVTLSSPKWIVRLGKALLSVLLLVVLADLVDPVSLGHATGLDIDRLGSSRLRRHIYSIDQIPEQHIFRSNPGMDSSVLPEEPDPSSYGQDAAESPREHLTLVTNPSSSSPFSVYAHMDPYNGTMYHISTSIHPSKHRSDTAFRVSSIWNIEQDEYDEWIGRDVQARITPNSDLLRFTCVFTNAPGNLTEEVNATSTNQARNEYLLVECVLPSWIKDGLTTEQPQDIRTAGLNSLKMGTLAIKTWFDFTDCVPKASTPILDNTLRNQLCQAHTEVRVGSIIPGPSHLISPSDWSAPSPQNGLSICVSPVRLRPMAENPEEVDLRKLVQWRVWHMYQGVTQVHWYSRDPIFRTWIDSLNRILGLGDTWLDAPVLSEQFPASSREYADQAIYAADCLSRYGITDKYQAYIDFDEFLLVSHDPHRNATLNRLEQLDEDIGSLGADHTYYGGEHVASLLDERYRSDSFPPNAWTRWNTLEKLQGFRRQKSVHWTSATRMIWVHSSARLGEGYRRIEDTYVAMDNSTRLEILHNRKSRPEELTFDHDIDSQQIEAWKDTWAELAGILSSAELQQLHKLKLGL
ncbi:uncharacterized protein I303_106358 [Kwoniella dejecticola CBS 10117]|uniref:Glycosyltransferase family 92 protein n=1 Tax=Kwoniella dejecticola CBS 10117 TaxID=1296121 RepID=A0A1A5ZUY4_9TREE|nr:uncharacterized protein I303_08385 [Kwoniella dejecticola CBS 10117]OBR81614.1 hypothetical protein I303_08385 [Kwoniella dejecticola CBS 10117]